MNIYEARQVLNAPESETTLSEYIKAMQAMKKIGCTCLQDVFDWLDKQDEEDEERRGTKQKYNIC